MAAPIGNFVKPVRTCKLTSAKSVKVRNGQKFWRKYPTDLSTFLFPSRPHMTSTWQEVVLTAKPGSADGTDEVAVMLGDGGGEIVVPELAATPPIAWKAWRWQRTKVSKL